MVRKAELIALVALLKYGAFRKTPMSLRQRIIEGDLVTRILSESPEADYARASRDVSEWIVSGERPLCWFDDEYPSQLSEVHDFPLVVFVRGQLKDPDPGISIIGSRSAGETALNAVRVMARNVVDRGWAVVSGLAKGVDTEAHAEALRIGGRTVAVIGNGIDHVYPAANRALQRRIEARGLVLSQFWPGTRPARFTFPARNAVMSGYARATIIVAAEETSGTRHQARQAVAHGRPVVISRPVYEGTTWGRELVDDLATLVRVADTVEEAVRVAVEMAEFRTPSLNSLMLRAR